MLPSPAQDLKAFVPARDYTLAKQFYLDLGFTLDSSSEQIAEFSAGSFRFLLQPFYVKELWWQHIERIELVQKYPGIVARAPAMQPWGLRVLYVSDPTGVLWHITERNTA
jgi:hypothetical protein